MNELRNYTGLTRLSSIDAGLRTAQFCCQVQFQDGYLVIRETIMVYTQCEHTHVLKWDILFALLYHYHFFVQYLFVYMIYNYVDDQTEIYTSILRSVLLINITNFNVLSYPGLFISNIINSFLVVNVLKNNIYRFFLK